MNISELFGIASVHMKMYENVSNWRSNRTLPGFGGNLIILTIFKRSCSEYWHFELRRKNQKETTHEIQCETTGIVTNIQEPFLFCGCSSWLIVHGAPAESTGPVHLPPRTPCAQPFPLCLCQSRKRFGPCCNTLGQLERLHKFHRLGWGGWGGNNVGCLHLHTHTHCTWCYATLAVSWGLISWKLAHLAHALDAILLLLWVGVKPGSSKKKAALPIWQETTSCQGCRGNM